MTACLHLYVYKYGHKYIYIHICTYEYIWSTNKFYKQLWQIDTTYRQKHSMFISSYHILTSHKQIRSKMHYMKIAVVVAAMEEPSLAQQTFHILPASLRMLGCDAGVRQVASQKKGQLNDPQPQAVTPCLSKAHHLNHPMEPNVQRMSCPPALGLHWMMALSPANHPASLFLCLVAADPCLGNSKHHDDHQILRLSPSPSYNIKHAIIRTSMALRNVDINSIVDIIITVASTTV